MGLLENIKVAFTSVWSNWLRAILTTIIIAFGIMALVGILTAIDAAIYSLSSNLSRVGANTFTIEQVSLDVKGSKGRRFRKFSPPFTYDQAMLFMEQYQFPADVSISFFAQNTAVIKHKKKETNPNTSIIGATSNYIKTKGYDIETGRNFTSKEAIEGSLIGVIGSDIAAKLFNNNAASAIGQTISTNGLKIRVIGVTAAKGSSFNQSQDNQIIIPLQTAKRFYGNAWTNYKIMVAVEDPILNDAASEEAVLTMRNVRKLKASMPNNFKIKGSSNLADKIKENTLSLRLGAISIGLMTLLGAAIGLMNIMLVSVTERTKEIGVRKALGATSKNILTQFLIEATIICQIGGILGIILGVVAGNVVTVMAGGTFLIPWTWIALAVIVCTAVGLLAGIYPAMRAAQLDPIESLRHE